MTDLPGKTVVVALGGNAILQAGQKGTFEEQTLNVERACAAVAEMLLAGWRVVLTHGNGPQVGNIIIQNEAGSELVPSMPMDVCGAESQGQIGYMIQQSMRNQLQRLGVDVEVACVITETIVDENDPAFSKPSKPVGPFYTEEKARELVQEKGFVMKEDSGRGWRRVVPSPDPKEILQKGVIRKLVDARILVVSTGGGGIPVVREKNGKIHGTEAVIDKDLGAARLAMDLEADLLMILTDVPKVYLNYNQPSQKGLDRIGVEEIIRYQGEGHFRAGSMGPKVEAAIRFAKMGKPAVIARLSEALTALRGESGTWILPSGKARLGLANKGSSGFKTLQGEVLGRVL